MEHTFVTQAIIYLGAAVLMVPLSKRLGFGSVLGYLLAGVLIGPYVLGLTGEEGEDLMGFAEMGVVMMLFLIGLDIEPKMLWRLRQSILGLGTAQVLLTGAAIGFVAHTFFNMTLNQGIALGLIFAMSSTAIVIQTMSENNWTQTSAGKNAFSVLLFQDIAAIIILGILPLLGTDKSVVSDGSAKTVFLQQFPAWARTMVVFGGVVVVIIVGRYFTRPVFQMVASTNLRELFAATALLIVLLISGVMSLVGLSPALGAFLGGVVLANSEYRHELEGDIEPFKGLLLGLFFIIIGASIDFHLIEKNPLIVLLSVLGVMITKLVLLALLGRIFKMSRKQYLLFAFALAQIGEFAFVLLTFSKSQGIFAGETFKLLMVIVAVSMSFSPIFMIFLDKVWMAYVYTHLNKYFSSRGGSPTEKQTIIEETQKVLIAGYGRFGSVIGRFLTVNGIESTILDVDSDRIEALRKMGITAYYGDALRLDLLKGAGADTANLIVVALNGKAKKLQMVKTIKKHFPNAHIIARAHDQADAYELMDAGVLHVYRETLDTSLRAGRDALSLLGFNEKIADRAAELFLAHDEKTLKTLAAARFDKERYYELIKSGISDLQLVIQNDLKEHAQLNAKKFPINEEDLNPIITSSKEEK